MSDLYIVIRYDSVFDQIHAIDAAESVIGLRELMTAFLSRTIEGAPRDRIRVPPTLTFVDLFWSSLQCASRRHAHTAFVCGRLPPICGQ